MTEHLSMWLKVFKPELILFLVAIVLLWFKPKAMRRSRRLVMDVVLFVSILMVFLCLQQKESLLVATLFLPGPLENLARLLLLIYAFLAQRVFYILQDTHKAGRFCLGLAVLSLCLMTHSPLVLTLLALFHLFWVLRQILRKPGKVFWIGSAILLGVSLLLQSGFLLQGKFVLFLWPALLFAGVTLSTISALPYTQSRHRQRLFLLIQPLSLMFAVLSLIWGLSVDPSSRFVQDSKMLLIFTLVWLSAVCGFQILIMPAIESSLLCLGLPVLLILGLHLDTNSIASLSLILGSGLSFSFLALYYQQKIHLSELAENVVLFLALITILLQVQLQDLIHLQNVKYYGAFLLFFGILILLSLIGFLRFRTQLRHHFEALLSPFLFLWVLSLFLFDALRKIATTIFTHWIS